METVSFTEDELEHLKRKIRKAASIATMMENDLEEETNEVGADAAGVVRELLRSVLKDMEKQD